MTKRFCFTVDVDRDVNECVPGRTAAASLRGNVRFTSSETGTNAILDMLDALGIKATFFVEARTLENIDASFGNNEVSMHGLDHEDMTGEMSGIALSDDELSDIMQRSSDIIKDRTGTGPKGFRAPYMRTNEKIMRMLPKFGVGYDSSVYSELGRKMHPYDIGGITEIPVPVGRDGSGKRIYGYLWPMHEGLRRPEEYVRMSQTVEEGVFVIATHSWHIAESRDGTMSKERTKKNVSDTRETIASILDGGFRAVRMADAASEAQR